MLNYQGNLESNEMRWVYPIGSILPGYSCWYARIDTEFTVTPLEWCWMDSGNHPQMAAWWQLFWIFRLVWPEHTQIYTSNTFFETKKTMHICTHTVYIYVCVSVCLHAYIHITIYPCWCDIQSASEYEVSIGHRQGILLDVLRKNDISLRVDSFNYFFWHLLNTYEVVVEDNFPSDWGMLHATIAGNCPFCSFQLWG